MQTAFIPPEPSTTILEMPKCNIHTHLEGSVRPQTYLKLAAEQGVPLPFDADKVQENLQVDGHEKTLVDYLDKIGHNYPILKNGQALHRTAFEAAEDAYRDGVIYLELRAGPALHTGPGLSIEAVIESMLAGLHEAESRFGIVAGLIVAGLRNHDPAINTQLAQIACRYRDQGVIGFDLAGDEAGFPAELHQEAFKFVQEAGLPYTVHAGEASGAENVRYAVEVLGATRIGHGVRSIESQSVLDLLRERQVLLEVCPTSNVRTGTVPSIYDHPLKALHEYGIPVSINDDDPITSRTRPSNELMLAHTILGMPLKSLIGIQLDTLEHSFLRDKQVVASLKSRVQAFASHISSAME
jgi:adenosine deaminase